MTISIEDFMYEIDFVAQVFKGLQDAENGKLISTEELLKRFEQWEI
jgi:predicted transcriptional regulator